MKKIPLRNLFREPLTAKRLTRKTKQARRKEINEILDEVLHEQPAKISAASLLEDSRR